MVPSGSQVIRERDPLLNAFSTLTEQRALAHDLRDAPEVAKEAQRRLVGIARTVATQPSILLLDEPAAGLDERSTAELSRLIRALADDWGMGVLLIEHDVKMVLGTCDRVMVLQFGRPIAAGTPTEVRADPVVISAYLGGDDAADEVPVAGDLQDSTNILERH